MTKLPFNHDLLVIDTETTGLTFGVDKVIELAAVRMEPENGIVINSFHRFIAEPDVLDGTLSLNPKALETNKISVELISNDGVSPYEAYKDFLLFCADDSYATGFNLAFDLQMLEFCMKQYDLSLPKNIRFFDTMELSYRLVSPNVVPDNKQSTLVNHFKTSTGKDAHRADVDCEELAGVIVNLMDIYKAKICGFDESLFFKFKTWISSHEQPQLVPFGKHRGLEWTDRQVVSYCKYMVGNVMKEPSYLKNCCLHALGQKLEETYIDKVNSASWST